MNVNNFNSILNKSTWTLFIGHNETYTHARCHPHYVKVIEHRGQARTVRKKTRFQNVITGDIFYSKLYWINIDKSFGLYKASLPRTGMAIVRDNKIIWYSMPGIPDGLSKRKVIVEKYLYDAIKEKRIQFYDNRTLEPIC